MKKPETAFEAWEQEVLSDMQSKFDDWIWIGSNKIHKTALINWDIVTMGDNNIIGAHCVIGDAPQHRSESASGIVEIGSNNVIREYCTVNAPTRWSGRTAIGNNCYFMINVHTGHDTIVEDNVTIANNFTPGGHAYIMKNTTIGFNVNIHQYQVIGSYCMLGMGCVISKHQKVSPGTVWAGNPGQKIKPNLVGIERAGIKIHELFPEEERMADIIKERSTYKF